MKNIALDMPVAYCLYRLQIFYTTERKVHTCIFIYLKKWKLINFIYFHVFIFLKYKFKKSSLAQLYALDFGP